MNTARNQPGSRNLNLGFRQVACPSSGIRTTAATEETRPPLHISAADPPHLHGRQSRARLHHIAWEYLLVAIFNDCDYLGQGLTRNIRELIRQLHAFQDFFSLVTKIGGENVIVLGS